MSERGGDIHTATKLPFKSLRLRITADDLDKFARLKHTRPLRPAKVRHFVRALEDGGTIVMPISVNRTGGSTHYEDRVFDGNHRLEAVHGFLEKHPAAAVWLEFHVYDNLSGAEELAEYERINDPRTISTQSPDDQIVQLQETFPIFSMLRGGFPAPVRIGKLGSRTTGFQFRWLCQAYLTRGSQTMSAGNLVARIRDLRHEDYEAMKEAAVAFIAGAGTPGAECVLSKPGPLACFFKVWNMNEITHEISRDEFVRRWKHAANSGTLRVIAQGTRTGSELRNMTSTLIAEMNRVPQRQGWLPDFPAFLAGGSVPVGVKADG